MKPCTSQLFCINCRNIKVSAFQCIKFDFCKVCAIITAQEVFPMIDTHDLKSRDHYLNKLIAFRDTEPVKVVTGIRRCGKSSLLKLMVQHLKGTGIEEDQIIEMNFESHEFKKMNADDFYYYVKERVLPGKRIYLFFDELQRIDHWEDTMNSFRVDFNCDIYITGSNAYLLSSEYSIYLSGRCVA